MMAANGKATLILDLLLLCMLRHGVAQQYNAIWSFGDSISDTGNLCVGGCPAWLTMGQPPYGETFFHRPTGRCSDGRVIVDFLAEHFGLPLPPASKAGGDFKKGANMAIISATTMNSDFFNSIGLRDKIWNNGPLDTQIQWFRQLLPSVCGNGARLCAQGRHQAHRRPRDNHQEWSGGRGGPGLLPIGCLPTYLTLFGTSNAADYDHDGCLRNYNDLSSYHNALLKRSLSNLRRTYPHTRIMYADFYTQVTNMIRTPHNFGLKYGLKVCCGAGGQGKYNYNNSARCGMSGASACTDPGNYLIWDGIHLTEAAYRSIADGWLKGPYCNPPIQH
ncbi:hypothetical protein BDA96_09G082700 [Sorghum bicolor]|uniref:GDSL esterase/lipase n=1 Tax=Sorghum bicolor TaxID=4558 RepID=A0A921U4E0_SORBI|nr:hypothetical protein BDA96_09G082700 [Sorghum bicolor]